MNIQPSKPLMIEFFGTPEAGKTSLIHNLEEKLSKSVSVLTLQESAEIAPTNIPKGSLDAHFWMKFNTMNSILKAQHLPNYDIILIDRGIMDLQVWNYYHYIFGNIDEECYKVWSSLPRICGLHHPELVFCLTTTPEESIKRRGGEGRIVTKKFIKEYNIAIRYAIRKCEDPIFTLDTTNITKIEKVSIILNQILKKLSSN